MIWTKQQGSWQAAPLHDTLMGLPALIVCGGPSLARIDCDALQGPGRAVLALNNAAPKVRPDWWLGMDGPDCYERAILNESYPKLVHPGYWKEFDGTPNLFTADLVKNVAFYDGGERDVFRWDRDTFRVSIQLAIYLGCRNICLIGCDLSTQKQDYVDGSYLSAEQRASNQRLYDANYQFLEWHIQHRPFVKFISASHGSRINQLMPYMEVRKLLRQIEKAVPRGRKLLHNSMRDASLSIQSAP